MKFIRTILYALFATLLLASCSAFSEEGSDEYAETSKNVAGTWQLSTVSRNGTDITSAMNFSQFQLDLKADGTYTIANYLPFVVRDNGTWKADDPLYPFRLFFRENASLTEVSTELTYPIVNGDRIISITFSPGCGGNSYTYVFKKIL